MYNDIKVCGEIGSNVPVVVGDCPHCGLGNRSLILMGMFMNELHPQLSKLFFTCVGCGVTTERNLTEVAAEEN